MNIIGLDALVFGVDNLADCAQFLTDYGLIAAGSGRFEAADGTAVVIAAKDDPALPAPLPTGTSLRKTVYGVADRATLDAIARALGTDREVRTLPDGSIETVDDLGFALGFQVTVRRATGLAAEKVNAPGDLQRAANVLGTAPDLPVRPRTLSHVVYFVPDVKKAEAFYRDRLGFRTTDRLEPLGPFMQPGGTLDHHTLFLVQTPPQIQGVEHFTFHLGGPDEVMRAGTRMVKRGYQPFWGPGRHLLGSNWFWYFNSPFGCHIEYDADMDLHDATWTPRAVPMSAEASQNYLLQHRPKWSPGPNTPANGAYA